MRESVISDEETEESSDSTGSKKSNFDEDLEETVQKILEEMKNSKEKTRVEDADYIPSPIVTLDSSHSSDDIPLKICVEELSKRKEGSVLKNQTKNVEKRPQQKSFSDSEDVKAQPRSSTKKKFEENRMEKSSPENW